RDRFARLEVDPAVGHVLVVEVDGFQRVPGRRPHRPQEYRPLHHAHFERPVVVERVAVAGAEEEAPAAHRILGHHDDAHRAWLHAAGLLCVERDLALDASTFRADERHAAEVLARDDDLRLGSFGILAGTAWAHLARGERVFAG